MGSSLYKILLSDVERHFYYDGESRKANFWIILKSLFFNIRFLPVVLFRLSAYFEKNNFHFIAKIFSFWNFFVFGTEISSKCSVGPGLCFPHTLGSVIGAARIGKNALIYHGVTIGANYMDLGYRLDKRPLIGDNVTLGAGAKILGGVTIGNNVIVGANAVVVDSLPDNVVVGGIPAKIIRRLESETTLDESKESACEIFILMGTYNGAQFIEKQIASIQAQDHDNWRLIVRDDGSTDDTLQIVETIVCEDQRVHLLSDGKGHVGAVANFGLLLAYAKEKSAQYVALADQDDFWEKWKLKRQLRKMLETESGSENKPVLVYSDLVVVDENLRFISPSMMTYQFMRHETINPLEVLLVQNYVTGCTVLINNTLLDLAVPIPPSTLMHDWWLAMLAGACGNICYIDESLVYYRQHAENKVGALNPRIISWRKMWRFWEEGNKRFPQSIVQAQDLYERIDQRNLFISPEARQFIKNYLDIWSRQGLVLVRMAKLLRLGIRRQNFFTQTIFAIRCLLVRSSPK
ncbi:MAG: glycosyltransferase [Proteobacteria bacterium]|nr:glycosyltransferase [Pseudomonadota bacterium]MBU1715152.1 glycosyltransferase [Pseudomonadota bacterium]